MTLWLTKKINKSLKNKKANERVQLCYNSSFAQKKDNKTSVVMTLERSVLGTLTRPLRQ